MAKNEAAPIEISPESVVTQQQPAYKLALGVDISDTGPCKKHIRVKVPRNDIEHFSNEAVKDLVKTANVPGFRPGHVPRNLVVKKYKKEVGDHVKTKVLMMSLEQLADEHKLDAINEPDLDINALELPDDGDFQYEFDVEVRPEFTLPNYKGLQIKRPMRTVADADVDAYIKSYLAQFGQLVPLDTPAETGDYVIATIDFTSGDAKLNHLPEKLIRIRPTLRFQDAEIAGFDKLMVGAVSGDVREAETTISMEASKAELRGEKLTVRFEVSDVKRLRLPELNQEFLEQLNVETEEKLRTEVRDLLEKQVTYEQRQSARKQVLEQITESATWELPEALVKRQVENALRREILEMQQAGFTDEQIRARENELLQQQISMTRQALKEHFVLDKISNEEKLEVSPADIETEITYMAFQRGESPRKVRARLEKLDLMENLNAQILERKAIDVILDAAKFEDVPAEEQQLDQVEALAYSVSGEELATTVVSKAEEEPHTHDHDHDHDHDHGHHHDHG